MVTGPVVKGQQGRKEKFVNMHTSWETPRENEWLLRWLNSGLNTILKGEGKGERRPLKAE